MNFREPTEHVGYLIGDVSRMLRTVYDRRVEPLGLTRSQWRVLAMISRIEGCTQTALAGEIEIEKPTLGKLIDRLEQKQWVERRPDQNDARIKRLFLTKRAGPLLNEMFVLADDVLDAAISGLNGEEAEHLNKALLKINSNLPCLINTDLMDK